MNYLLKRLLFAAFMFCLSVLNLYAETDTTLFVSGRESFEEGRLDESEVILIEFLGGEGCDTLCKRPDLRMEAYLMLARIKLDSGDFDGSKKWLHCAHLFALKDSLRFEEYKTSIRNSFENIKQKQMDHQRTRKLRLILISVLAFFIVLTVMVFMVQFARLKKSYSKLADQARSWASIPDAPSMEVRQTIESPLLIQIRSLFSDDRLYLDSNLSLDSLCERLHSNRTYVSSAIRAVSPNFNRFVSEYRIKEAISLLEEGFDGTVEELALKCGYSNAKTFSSAFKDITGLTPGVFRQNI